MAYPFLPVNPCCTDVVINDPCGCSSTITNSGCNNNNPCSTHLTASSTIVYDGPALTCTTAEPCDTLNVILQKIDEIICNLLSQINILTNQVTNITTQIITINNQIININNTLDVCCNVTTTTTSTTVAPCESFSLNNTGTETVAVITTDCDTGELVAVVLEPGVTNICVQTDSPLSVPGTITVTPNGPCGPTTTTTTTIAPTTTTTTTAFECQCFTFFNSDTSAHVINYKDCNNINVGPIFIDSNETLQVCAGSGSASDPKVIISVGENCVDGACPVPTTTTTTTLYECTCYNTGATILQEVLDVTDNNQIILNYYDCFGNPQENIYDTAGFYLLGCVDFNPGIDSTALINGIIVNIAIGPFTVYEQCCAESPTTTTTTTVSPTTTTTTTIPCTCINIIISQADIDDATGNPTLNGNVNVGGSNGKQITCENQDLVMHYDTAGTYPYCLKTGAISTISLYYLKDGEPVTNIQSEIVNLQSACTVDGECGPTTTTTTSSSSTTTTTTTIAPTTTTTTTVFTPFLNNGSSSVQANPAIAGCDPLDYPYTPAIFPFPPSLVAVRVTNLSVTWSDIEYVEIVSVTDDPNMVITYDGNVVAPAMQFIPATDSTWQYPLSMTIDTFSCINTSETWEIRVKLTGYPISNIADATINFLTNPYCPDCVSTTTTTTTFPPLLLCVTYEVTGENAFVNWTDCNGEPQSYELTVFETYSFCALEDTVTADPGVTIDLVNSSCTVGECIDFFASGGVSGGTVNYNDCDGNPQSFIVPPTEVSASYCGIASSILAGGTTISITGPCGV